MIKIGGLVAAAAALLASAVATAEAHGLAVASQGACDSRVLALSPENGEAASLGPLTAYLEGQGGGRGAVWLKLPNGEVVKGQFEIKAGGSVGALGKAYGIDRRGAAYTSRGAIITHGSPAFIDMTGPGGAHVHCELINENGEVHGSGVCRFNQGAVYRVLY